MKLSVLKDLCGISATSGDEEPVKKYILKYVSSHKETWKVQPQIIEGEGFQDALILVFGKPEMAYYSHMDSVGFTTRYQNQLVAIGSPDPEQGDKLVGEDHIGLIECEVQVDSNGNAFHNFARAIEPGTSLVYKPEFIESGDTVTSNSLDNRLGIFTLLQLAPELENGALVFSTYEEHGGGSVGFIANYLLKTYGILKSLIVDVTWVTDGVHLGHGPVVSLRDAFIPRKKFVNKITSLLDDHSMVYQKEVEGKGGSDGSELQKSELPIDWCFLGVPVNHPHSSKEEANIFDIVRLITLLQLLSNKL